MSYDNLTCAFAWLGLAIAVSDNAVILPEGYAKVLMPDDKASKLREACRTGQVTTISPTPSWKYISTRGSYGTIQYPHGVWLERRASFYGKPTIPAQMTPEMRGVKDDE